jgi:hypothetical protein
MTPENGRSVPLKTPESGHFLEIPVSEATLKPS